MPAIAIDEESIPSFAERRRQASRELMRAEILTAAQHIIRTQGMDALSLRAIAKSVGVTAPALYEYFPNKDAILRALFVQGSALLLDRLDQRIETSPPGMQTLLGVLQGYRDFARDEPDYFRLLFGTIDPVFEHTEADHGGMHLLFERFIGIIVSAIENGELQPLPPLTVGCSLWSLIHGVAMLETESFMAQKDMDGNGKGPQFDSAVKLVLRSLATPLGVELIGPMEIPEEMTGECR